MQWKKKTCKNFLILDTRHHQNKTPYFFQLQNPKYLKWLKSVVLTQERTAAFTNAITENPCIVEIFTDKLIKPRPVNPYSNKKYALWSFLTKLLPHNKWWDGCANQSICQDSSKVAEEVFLKKKSANENKFLFHHTKDRCLKISVNLHG
jgi:uncharacterized protein VirK/YbjX